MSLPEAIEKAKTLWSAQRAQPTRVDAVRGYLGYSSDSGTARRTISALIQFGLLAEVGKGDGYDRMLKLTEEARKLSLLPEDHPDALAIVRDLAVRPKIYAEMAAKWSHSLPADQQLQIFLTVEKKYNVETVPELIRDFRTTYEYAKLGDRSDDLEERTSSDEDGTSRSEDAGSAGDEDKGNLGQTGVNYKGTTSYTLPIAAGRVAFLLIPPDMTARDFRLISKGLDLVRESVLDEEADAQSENKSASKSEERRTSNRAQLPLPEM